VTVKATVAPVPRLALSIAEAAAAVGWGETFFREEVLPTLPHVAVGTKVAIDVEDLRAWLKEHRVTKSGNRTGQARTTPSGSVTKASAESSPAERLIEQKLNAKLAASTAKQSRDAKVVHLQSSSSQRKQRADG
jgi:hypothetical protein